MVQPAQLVQLALTEQTVLQEQRVPQEPMERTAQPVLQGLPVQMEQRERQELMEQMESLALLVQQALMA
jgi:hypothetical protein